MIGEQKERERDGTTVKNNRVSHLVDINFSLHTHAAASAPHCSSVASFFWLNQIVIVLWGGLVDALPTSGTPHNRNIVPDINSCKWENHYFVTEVFLSDVHRVLTVMNFPSIVPWPHLSSQYEHRELQISSGHIYLSIIHRSYVSCRVLLLTQVAEAQKLSWLTEFWRGTVSFNEIYTNTSLPAHLFETKARLKCSRAWTSEEFLSVNPDRISSVWKWLSALFLLLSCVNIMLIHY